MKSITIVCFCLAILPALIKAEFEETLNQWALSGQPINGVFYPAVNGSLGSGTFSYTWKGSVNGVEVAMKFTSTGYKNEAVNEYKMYWYLGAIDNPAVEAYGIPSVHYFGRWGHFYMLGITLMEPHFNTKSRNNEINVLDILIIIREFVRVSKYIHSRGVYHEDIKRDNIMFKGHMGYIIDYNKASKLYQRSRSAHYLSQVEIQYGIREAKGDWIRFLSTMCTFVGVKFDFIEYDSDESNDSNEVMEVEHFHDNLPDTLQTLENIQHDGLRRVYVEFAKHCFDEDISCLDENNARRYAVDNSWSFYDQLYYLINSEIDKYVPHTQAVVSWLQGNQLQNAQRAMQQQGLPDISAISVPFQENEHQYPKPNFGYFTGQSSH